MQEIQKGIFFEDSFPGVTLGALIFLHGTILVDAPLRTEDARSWRATLNNQGSGGTRILVNLDAHPDRTLGARAMECTIIAHQKTAQVFRSRPSVFKGQNADSGAEWESYNDAVGTRWAAPDITFTNSVALHWGPPDVILEHHPGPALGSIWAILPELKIIFVGDTVTYNQPPFLTNSDIPAWLESLEILSSSYKGFTLVSGRGGPVPYEAVRGQQRILKDVLKGMERLAKRNASPEATESLIPHLLSDLSYADTMEETFEQRLRHGLSQYYTRRYRPNELANLLKNGEGEQL